MLFYVSSFDVSDESLPVNSHHHCHPLWLPQHSWEPLMAKYLSLAHPLNQPFKKKKKKMNTYCEPSPVLDSQDPVVNKATCLPSWNFLYSSEEN